jgi:hypothetical protein
MVSDWKAPQGLARTQLPRISCAERSAAYLCGTKGQFSKVSEPTGRLEVSIGGLQMLADRA